MFVDILRDVLYALATPGIQEQNFFFSDQEKLLGPALLNFYDLNEIIKRLMSTSLMWAN